MAHVEERELRMKLSAGSGERAEGPGKRECELNAQGCNCEALE